MNEELKELFSIYQEIDNAHGEKFRKCLNCGDCCQGEIKITYLEEKVIINFLKEKRRLFSLIFKRLGKPTIICPFLDKSKKCLIYPVRPLICRCFGLSYLQLSTGRFYLCCEKLDPEEKFSFNRLLKRTKELSEKVFGDGNLKNIKNIKIDV